MPTPLLVRRAAILRPRVSGAPVFTTVVSDAFNRADGPLGNADSGQAWTHYAAGWTVASNAAKVTGAGAALSTLAGFDLGAGKSDVRVTGTIVSRLTSVGLFARYTDINNFVYCYLVGANQWRLAKRVAGTPTVLASHNGQAGTGAAVVFEAIGPVLRVVVNGTEEVNATDGFNQGATIHGILGGTTDIWDPFSLQVAS